MEELFLDLDADIDHSTSRSCTAWPEGRPRWIAPPTAPGCPRAPQAAARPAGRAHPGPELRPRYALQARTNPTLAVRGPWRCAASAAAPCARARRGLVPHRRHDRAGQLTEMYIADASTGCRPTRRVGEIVAIAGIPETPRRDVADPDDPRRCRSHHRRAQPVDDGGHQHGTASGREGTSMTARLVKNPLARTGGHVSIRVLPTSAPTPGGAGLGELHLAVRSR